TATDHCAKPPERASPSAHTRCPALANTGKALHTEPPVTAPAPREFMRKRFRRTTGSPRKLSRFSRWPGASTPFPPRFPVIPAEQYRPPPGLRTGAAPRRGRPTPGHRLRTITCPGGRGESENSHTRPRASGQLQRLHRRLLPGERDLVPLGQVHRQVVEQRPRGPRLRDRKSTRLNSSHVKSSYAVFCL